MKAIVSLGMQLDLKEAKRHFENEDAVNRLFHFLEANHRTSFDIDVRKHLAKSLVDILNRLYIRDDGKLSHGPTQNYLDKNGNSQTYSKRRLKVKS